MGHPPELVLDSWLSRQEQRHAGAEPRLHHRRSGGKQQDYRAPSGSTDLRDGRRCPYRTIFVISFSPVRELYLFPLMTQSGRGQNQCGLRDENTPVAFKPATVMREPSIKTSPADRCG